MKNNTIEYKKFDFEFKMLHDDEDKEFYHIEGIMSTASVDDGDDVVLPSAIMESIKVFGIPKFLYNHDTKQPLGVIDEIIQDTQGRTIMTGRMPKGLKIADDVALLGKMKSKADGKGAFGGMSIGYIVLERDFKDDIRIITKLHILENSIATLPMNTETEITNVKSNGAVTMLKEIEESKGLDDIEGILRKTGLSQKESKALISKVSEIKTQRDVDAQRDADQKVKDDEAKSQRDAEDVEIKSSFSELLKTANKGVQK